MVDVQEFMALPDGLEFAAKVENEWRSQGDESFVEWLVQNHASLGQYRLRHALVIVEHIDSPALRSVMAGYVGHSDPGYWVAANAFFHWQVERGFIKELPEGLRT